MSMAAERFPRREVRHARRAAPERVRHARHLLASYVPFTARFARAARERVRERMAAFHALAALDRDTRADIADDVDGAEVRMARMELRRRGTVFLVGMASLVGFLAYSQFFFPGHVLADLEVHLQAGGRLHQVRGVLLGAFLVAVLATLAGAVAAERMSRRKLGRQVGTRVVLAAVVLFFAALVAHGVVGTREREVSPLLFMAALYLCTLVAFVLTALVTWRVSRHATRLYHTRWRAMWPDACVVHELVSILVLVERRSARGRSLSLDVRRELMDRLETVAVCLEQHLPRRLDHADAHTDAWLRERTRGMAAWFRERKRGLCLPRGETREELVGQLAQALVHAARGEWDLLESAEAPAVPEPKRRTPAEIAARSLLYVGVAAVLVWDKGSSPAALASFAGSLVSELSGVLLPLVVPVAAYTLVRAVNPTILENLPTARELAARKKE